MTTTNTEWATVAHFVDRFEDARGKSLTDDLADFLPALNHPLYLEVAAELVRVDLEYQWQSGVRRPLTMYRQLVPQLFADPGVLANAAYEEFRQRRMAGDTIQPQEYAERYEIDTSGWPDVEFQSSVSVDGDNRPKELAFPEPGESFAGFQLIEEIGRGAFARVYLAEQDDLARRQVVLKVTASQSLEPQHLARLQHTNIVPIHSVHREECLLAICMPYFGDRTLADLICAVSQGDTLPASGKHFLDTVAVRQDETIAVGRRNITTVDKIPGGAPSDSTADSPWAQLNYVDSVLAITADTAAGLRHAHERGIVHRDVKPANILVTHDGQPMLLDFNLSDDLGIQGRESLTAGGTLPYMSPEHLRAIQRYERITPPSDIYSLGVILFELLAGERPFRDPRGTTDEAIGELLAERSSNVLSVRTHNRKVPPSVDAIIRKCLAPDVAHRYGAVAELQEDLRCHFENRPLVHAPNPSLSERIDKWRRRHRRLVSASSLSGVAVLVLVLFGALWAARASHIADLEADDHYQMFLDQLPTTRLAISLPGNEVDLIRRGVRQGEESAQLYAAIATDDWRQQEKVRRLEPTKRDALGQQLAELHYLLARGEAILAQHAESSELQQEHAGRGLQFNRVAFRCLSPGSSSPALGAQQKKLLQLAGKDISVDEPSPPTGPTGAIDAYLQPQELLASGAYHEAAPLLDQLRRSRPTDPVLWYLAGYTEACLGKPSAAEGCYTTTIVMRPDSFVGFYNRGLSRIDLQDFEGALADFSEVLKLRPELSCARLNRAIVHESLGQFREALNDLEAAMATGDFPSRAYFLRARVRKRLGDLAGAEQDLAAGLADLPLDELGWVARGIARLKNDPPGALSDFRQALDLNPNSRTALKNIVHVTADQLDQPQEALAAFDQWLALDPNDANALIGRAVVNARQGRRDNALADIQAAMVNSKESIVLFQAACALSLTADDNNRDAERALLMLSRSIELDPRWQARVVNDPDLAKLRERREYTAWVAAKRELSVLKQELMKAGQR